MSKADTKELILNAAESVFSTKGYRGASLRVITSKAGANLAAVNYHFGSKKALLEAVCERRLIPLNKLRMARLKLISSEARQKGKRPAPKGVLAAFIEPTLEFKDSSAGAREFIALVGRSFSDYDDTVRKVFLRFMKPTVDLLFTTLCEAMPETPKDVLFWRLQFTIGAMAHTMQGHTEQLLKSIGINAKSKVKVEKITEMLVEFVSAGMVKSK